MQKLRTILRTSLRLKKVDNFHLLNEQKQQP
jgi:hypothetical protein